MVYYVKDMDTFYSITNKLYEYYILSDNIKDLYKYIKNNTPYDEDIRFKHGDIIWYKYKYGNNNIIIRGDDDIISNKNINIVKFMI